MIVLNCNKYRNVEQAYANNRYAQQKYLCMQLWCNDYSRKIKT